MQPKERRETGEHDLFRSRLDEVVDLQHALVRLTWSSRVPPLRCKTWSSVVSTPALGRAAAVPN